MLEKIKSRKFILAVISAISGVAISLSAMGGKVGLVCAVISAIIPPITYIITEGVIDARAVGLTQKAIGDIADIWLDLEDENYDEITVSSGSSDDDDEIGG